MSHQPNVYEERARAKKVVQLADCLWSLLDASDRVSPVLVENVSAWGRVERNLLARAAGAHPPSEETWAGLCAALDMRVKIAREASGLYGPERGGLAGR